MDLTSLKAISQLVAQDPRGASIVAVMKPVFHQIETDSPPLVRLCEGFIQDAEVLVGLLSDETAFTQLDPWDRFDALFTLFSHCAYTAAVHQIFDENEIDLADHFSQKLPPLDEAPVLFNYQVLDTARHDNTLFALYSRYLAVYLRENLVEQGVISLDDLDDILTEITRIAGENLFEAAVESPDSWMCRWICADLLCGEPFDFSHMGPVTAQLAHRLCVPNLSTPGWTAYREHIKGLALEPIFGSHFGIADLFVMPDFTYHHQEHDRVRSSPIRINGERDHKLNPGLAPVHLILSRGRHRHPAFLFGGPGSGKTSFCKILASRLAEIPGVHPVFVYLKKLDPTAHFYDELTRYLKETPLREAVADLPQAPRLVFILDGFDELAHATKDKMEYFFKQVEEAQKPGARFDGAFFLLSGKPTLFSEHDVRIPAGSHIFSLERFDQNRIDAWSRRWNKLMQHQGEDYFNGSLYWNTDFHDIAVQPLLLQLLAHLQTEGLHIDPHQTEVPRAVIYSNMIDWVCDRHAAARAEPDSEIDMSRSEMRTFLRLAGFATHLHNQREIHMESSRELIEDARLNPERVKRRENYRAVESFLTCSFHKVGQSSWEFLHQSFAEYLAAEYMIEELLAIAALNKEADRARNWIIAFAPMPVSIEVARYLESMLERLYMRERAQFAHLFAVVESIYVRTTQQRDWQDLLTVADRFDMPPTRAYANSIAAVLLIAARMARIASTPAEPRYFQPETLAPGSWIKVYGALHPWYSIPEAAARLFPGISLGRPGGFDTTADIAAGMCFDYLHFNGFAVRPVKMVRASFRHADLRGEHLAGADLRGADFMEANLTGCKLLESVLTQANFMNATLRDVEFCGANMIQAQLIRADLRDADLRGVDFRGANLMQASLNKANLRRIDLRAANLGSADLSEADMVSAKLVSAYLNRAVLRATLLMQSDLRMADLRAADLTGANLEDGHLGGATLLEAVLEEACMARANLSCADLTDAFLDDADLPGCNLVKACLHGASACGVNLNGANLENADLRGIDLEGARADGADFRHADLTGANLTNLIAPNADFTGAILTGANLKGAEIPGTRDQGPTSS